MRTPGGLGSASAVSTVLPLRSGNAQAHKLCAARTVISQDVSHPWPPATSTNAWQWTQATMFAGWTIPLTMTGSQRLLAWSSSSGRDTVLRLGVRAAPVGCRKGLPLAACRSAHLRLVSV